MTNIPVTPYLVAPLLSWFIIQLVKFSISLVKGEANFRYLFASGGMPSAHSGIVCTLTTIALIEEGIGSPLFGITAILAAIVVYDSFGVRRSAGDAAHTLNKLIDDLTAESNVKTVQHYTRLREILGHKPTEVFVGSAIGVIVALIYDYNKVSDKLSFLFAVPTKIEIIITAAVGAALLVGSLIYGRMIKNKAKHILAFKKFRKQVLGFGITGSIVFLLLSFAEYQNALYLSMRIFSWGLLMIWAVLAASTCYKSVIILRKASLQAQLQERKLKWLKKAGKKK